MKNDYHYVFEPQNALHYYRHLLFIGWRVLRIAPDNNRLFLDKPAAQLDKVSEVVMRSLYLTRIPRVLEVLDRLYWDKQRGCVRRGIIDSRRVTAGDLLHRFPVRIRQLEKTYDLFSLNADQLIDLLGNEFQFDNR